jgi:transposase
MKLWSQDAARMVKEDIMTKVLVDDALWEMIEPLLPKWTPSPRGGQPRKPDRLCLSGILIVLKTGIAWEDFPKELGCCGMTLWNRLHEWTEAAVWPRLHRLLLDRLREADQIDFSRVIVDSGIVRAIGGAKRPARIPRIAASPAPSTMSSARRKGFRWRRGSPAPIATTARNSSRW